MLLTILLDRKLKEHIIYPRTGYANFEAREIKFRLNSSISIRIDRGVFVLATTLIFFLLLTSNSGSNDTIRLLILPFVSISIAVSSCFQAYRLRLTRFYFLSNVSIILGVGLWFYWLYRGLHTTLWFEVALYMIGWGLAESILGILVLRTYLRQNPLPAKRGN